LHSDSWDFRRVEPRWSAINFFADVLAGRLAGLFTILVTPLGHHEPWFTRVKRPFERQVLRWMKSHDLDWYTSRGREDV
jgi:hypothetical protein